MDDATRSQLRQLLSDVREGLLTQDEFSDIKAVLLKKNLYGQTHGPERTVPTPTPTAETHQPVQGAQVSETPTLADAPETPTEKPDETLLQVSPEVEETLEIRGSPSREERAPIAKVRKLTTSRLFDHGFVKYVRTATGHEVKSVPPPSAPEIIF
ncbi:hypothetical protein CYMTET_2817 [Cymbomonas tetramitiformis]|uniref:SHOCT domain-containing protein n=1 Tax=Cymbomonas tetramitiformis TaxID=36881 RepID=A0AAE0H4K1_9CHLO|nr:hypothetical protein CYMTET_2817 [Cymbomonas tetramitiformis]